MKDSDSKGSQHGFLAAIIAGLVGNLAISMLIAMAPRTGLPKMDIVDMRSTMIGKTNRSLGWMMHLMLGVIFALIYAYLWSSGIGSATLVNGVIFGAVHWLVVGMVKVIFILLLLPQAASPRLRGKLPHFTLDFAPISPILKS